MSVRGEQLYGETGGMLGRFADVTPDRAPKSFAPGETLTLEPLELRLFEGRRDIPAARSKARPGSR